MNEVDFYKKYLQIEEELGLFHVIIDGTRFWDRLRVPAFYALLRQSRTKERGSSPKNTRPAKLRRFLVSIARPDKNALLSPPGTALFVASSRRVLEEDGYWWDIYTDPIISRMQSKSAVVESAFMNKHYQPAKTRGLRYLDFIEFLGYFLRTARIVRVEFTAEEANLLGLLRRRLLEEFGISLDIAGMTRRILEERRVRVPLFKWLLAITRPSVVVLAQGYQWEDMIEACKAHRIPSIELQHGVISPYSIAYSYEGSSRDKDLFADYLLVFGDYWKDCAEYPIPKDRVVSVGFPYFESKRKQYSQVEKREQVLFVSQDTVGHILSRVASELSSVEDFEYSVVYKMHPQEYQGWREKYPWLVSSKVRVVDQPRVRLYELFAQSMIQVGVYSTALYEGLGFGLKTYIFEAPGSVFARPLYEGGLAEKVSSVKELLECIKSHRSGVDYDMGQIFKSNAAEDIISFISMVSSQRSHETNGEA